ncbi:apolipoprotein D [Tetranychus urticae]|uniref:Lipocalin/cytosolic fatty-acid binding domain-containing protein n=1 Tax=Tetranychus urticae TaxID=32264 RepID=T1K2R3_TETUR|nr:apolipoprotein D [Tetranychus urticae]
MKMIATIFVVFAFAYSALGECPTPPVAPDDADVARIVGRWYEIARPTTASENGLTCVTCNVTPRDDGDFNITNLGTKPDGSMASEYAIAKRTSSQSLLHINPIAIKIPFAIPFNIAATDYDNYLVAYTCLRDVKRGWILSRSNSMSEAQLTELTNLLATKYGVSLDETEFTSHKDCKYWPA